MTDADDAARLVEVTIARFGRIDVLINNAGRAMAKPVEHIDLAEYTGLLWLNVLAPLRLMQLVIPRMRQQGGGQIVNISSQASTKYIPFRRLRLDQVRPEHPVPYRARRARQGRHHRQHHQARDHRHRLRPEHPQYRTGRPTA